jgi:hypothetical protein
MRLVDPVFRKSPGPEHNMLFYCCEFQEQSPCDEVLVILLGFPCTAQHGTSVATFQTQISRPLALGNILNVNFQHDMKILCLHLVTESP